MKFLTVGGFLGSGKTSFLLRLARHMTEKLGIEKIVILENEIGKISIDDMVIRSAGYEVKGMFAGCVCCTMAGELPLTVKAIEADLRPDWIIMEATGMAFPQNVKENLMTTLGLESRVCCLVDAKRWNRLLKPMEHLLPLQLQEADTVLINKTDLVDAETLDAVRESVKTFCGGAEVFSVSAEAGIDGCILDTVLGLGV